MSKDMELDGKGLEAARNAYLKLEHDFYKPVENVVRAYLTASGLTGQIDDLSNQLQSSLDRLKELERERDHWESRANDRGLEAEKWFRKYGQHLERADALAAELEKYKTWFEMKSKSNAKALAQLSQVNLDNVVLREELACTYEELIEHSGDDMGDSRAKRVAELRATLSRTVNAVSNQPTASLKVEGEALRELWMHYDYQAGRWCVW